MVGLTISVVYPQTTQPSGVDWSPKLRRAAENALVDKINDIRTSAKLPPLERASPSVEELELVCTAAFTGRKVGDPLFADLETYVTDDLSVETEPLKDAALGPEPCRGPRSWYPAYCHRKRPRYSVIIERNANSTPDKPVYTVGVARRPSAILEFFGPLMSDVPFKGMNEWKKQVVPECQNRKTESSR